MSYYFGNPQLFKMPKKFREPGPPLTPSVIARGAHTLGEITFEKALPYVAGAIIAFVAYNMFVK